MVGKNNTIGRRNRQQNPQIRGWPLQHPLLSLRGRFLLVEETEDRGKVAESFMGDPHDLLGMSLDHASHRDTRPSDSSGGVWSSARGGGARGREAGGGGGGMRSEVSVISGGGGTFRSAIASTRAPQGSAGPIRRAGIARNARETAAPYQRPTRGTESIYARLGEPMLL